MCVWNEKLYPGAEKVQPHEPTDAYAIGALHPVALGDTFDSGRYLVRHKLGFGSQATVWLARDQIESRWCALKIKRASLSLGKLEDDHEISILNKLEKQFVASIGVSKDATRYYAKLLHSFRHRGPNGTHNCLVLELLGPSVTTALQGCARHDETLRPDTILRSAKALLQGLKFAHEAGIVHADVSPNNVAFTSSLSQCTETDIFEALGGEPFTVENNGKDADLEINMPKQLVKTASWDKWTDAGDAEVRLIDWGLSFPIDRSATTIEQSMDLRAPETFFVGSFDSRLDTWRAGLVIYTLFFQEVPFEFRSGPDDFYIRKLISKLGPLPSDWQDVWEDMQRSNPYAEDEARQLDNIISADQTISQTFDRRRGEIVLHCARSSRYKRDRTTDYDLDELKRLGPIMNGLMQYVPSARISLGQAIMYINWVDRRNER